MSPEQRLERDRALRDAAWDVVTQDVTFLQSDLEERSIGGRVIDTIGEKARLAASRSATAAKRNRTAIALGAAGIGLWLGRHHLIAAARAWRRRHADGKPGHGSSGDEADKREGAENQT